jgi:hypothetical protein
MGGRPVEDDLTGVLADHLDDDRPVSVQGLLVLDDVQPHRVDGVLRDVLPVVPVERHAVS